MENTKLFGTKEKFAIEIKINSSIEKSNLRLWFCIRTIAIFSSWQAILFWFY